MRRYILFTLVLLSSISLSAQTAVAVYPYSFNGEWGIINAEQVVQFEPQLEHIELFDQGEKYRTMAIATQGEQKGLIDELGKWILKPKYDSISSPNYYLPHLRWAMKDGEFGLITTENKRAKFLIKPQFSEVKHFEGRKLPVCIVRTQTGYGAINGAGDIIAAPIYEEVKIVDDFSDYPDLKLVKNGEIIYVDSWGELLNVETMEEYEEEMIAFLDQSVEDVPYGENKEPSMTYQKNERTGHWEITTKTYNTTNNVFDVEILVLEDYDKVLKVDYSINYSNQINIRYIQVEKDGKLGLLNNIGEVITPVIYDRILFSPGQRYEEEDIYLYQKGLVGLANGNGKQILPAIFSALQPKYRTIEVTHPDGYFGYASWNGAIFLPLK